MSKTSLTPDPKENEKGNENEASQKPNLDELLKLIDADVRKALKENHELLDVREVLKKNPELSNRLKSLSDQNPVPSSNSLEKHWKSSSPEQSSRLASNQSLLNDEPIPVISSNHLEKYLKSSSPEQVSYLASNQGFSGDSPSGRSHSPQRGLSGGSPSSSSDRACFIATATYGSALCEEIECLRAFRNHYLISNRMGIKFLHFYNRIGPPLADYIKDRVFLKKIIRFILNPIVKICQMTMPYQKDKQ
jgi:hypothetical protein